MNATAKELRIAAWCEASRVVVDRLRMLLGDLRYKANFSGVAQRGLRPIDDIVWFSDPLNPSRPSFAVLALYPNYTYGESGDAIHASFDKGATFVLSLDTNSKFIVIYRNRRGDRGFNVTQTLIAPEVPEISISVAELFAGLDVPKF